MDLKTIEISLHGTAAALWAVVAVKGWRCSRTGARTAARRRQAAARV
ncbi:hypothetical protein ACIQ8D_23930 [Streptomyces sp. NPDC096094]